MADKASPCLRLKCQMHRYDPVSYSQVVANSCAIVRCVLVQVVHLKRAAAIQRFLIAAPVKGHLRIRLRTGDRAVGKVDVSILGVNCYHRGLLLR
jgi:hypothetical protein